MIIRKTFKAAALASVCLLPLVAAAQAADDTGFDLPEAMPNTQELKRISDQPGETNNEVTVGLRGQSSTSAEYGRYNGDYRQGASIIGDFKLSGRSDWKSTDTYYYNLNAQDLKLGFGGTYDLAPNSSLHLKVGNQGTWGLTADYDAITYVASNSFTTPFDKNGTLVNAYTLSTGAATSLARASLAENTDLVGTRRDRGSVELKYMLGDWAMTSGLVHEHKEGTMVETMTVGGTNTGLINFPMPINYDTDRFTAKAEFGTPKLQANVAYSFSNFRDNNAGGFAFQGFTLSTAASGATPVNGVYSQAPNNMAHQLSTQLGYNLTDTTRINANLVYGVQLQNDGLVAASLTPNTTSTYSGNPTSLDGMVQTMFGNVAITSRPFKDVDTRLSYTVDDRQSNTPNKLQVVGDPTDSRTSAAKYRDAIAVSWLKNTVAAEAGYRVLDNTKLTVGYNLRTVTRSEAMVHNTVENEATAKLRTTFTPEVTGSLGYSHSIRSASAPDYSVWQRVGNGTDCTQGNLPPNGCTSIPTFMAARTQDSISSRVNTMLGQDATAGFIAKGITNDYNDQRYGVIRDYSIITGPDLTYRFGPGAEAHAFYTYQIKYRKTNGQSRENNSISDTTNTTGISGSWQLTDDLKIGADYVYSYGSEVFEQSYGGWGSTTVGGGYIPNVTSMLNTVKVHGEYEYVPGITLSLGYGFDSLSTSDWALWGSGSAGQVLTGESNPSYHVHTVMSSVAFKW